MMAINFTAPPKEAAKPEVRDLDVDLSAIRLDQSAQPRENLNTDKTAEYAAAMKGGDQFPPLVVFHDGATYWLADGFHRHYAAQQADRKHIRCYVRQGGLRDAILYSVGANAKHGVPRSDADKERAVLRLLNDEEWSQWSDREIARRCHVDHKTVAKHRKAVSGERPQIERKVERSGTVYTQKVAKAKPATVRENRTVDVGGAETREITSETLAPQGGEGGAEPASAKEEITPPRNIFDEMVALWTEATAEDREAFIAYLRVAGFVPSITERPAALAVADGQPSIPTDDARGAGRGATAPAVIPQSSDAVTNPPSSKANSSRPKTMPAREAEPPPSVARAIPSSALSKADQIRLLRPNCRHADDLDKCAGAGRKHCRGCEVASAEGEAA